MTQIENLISSRGQIEIICNIRIDDIFYWMICVLAVRCVSHLHYTCAHQTVRWVADEMDTGHLPRIGSIRIVYTQINIVYTCYIHMETMELSEKWNNNDEKKNKNGVYLWVISASTKLNEWAFYGNDCIYIYIQWWALLCASFDSVAHMFLLVNYTLNWIKFYLVFEWSDYYRTNGIRLWIFFATLFTLSWALILDKKQK